MANEVLNAISGRRSIRKYKPEQITQEQLDAILKAAVEAPSASNGQPWHFTVVRDQEIIKQINEAACANLAKQGGPYGQVRDIFHGAPTVIFISANKELTPFVALDCGIAAQNMTLAAYSLGLGSVLLGLPFAAWDEENKDKFNAMLKFPGGYSFMLAISIGYADMTKEAHPVKSGLIDIID